VTGVRGVSVPEAESCAQKTAFVGGKENARTSQYRYSRVSIVV